GFFRMSLRIDSAPPGRFVHSAFCARSKLFAHGLAAFCASLLGRGGSGCADATSLDGAAGEGAGTGSAAADGGIGDSAAAGGTADAPAFVCVRTVRTVAAATASVSAAAAGHHRGGTKAAHFGTPGTRSAGAGETCPSMARSRPGSNAGGSICG